MITATRITCVFAIHCVLHRSEYLTIHRSTLYGFLFVLASARELRNVNTGSSRNRIPHPASGNFPARSVDTLRSDSDSSRRMPYCQRRFGREKTERTHPKMLPNERNSNTQDSLRSGFMYIALETEVRERLFPKVPVLPEEL